MKGRRVKLADVVVHGSWDDEAKRLPFAYEEVRGKSVFLHYYITPEERQFNEARAAVGRTVEGWLNHGATRVTVEECKRGIFCTFERTMKAIKSRPAARGRRRRK